MEAAVETILLPDAGPLITLAYSGALDLLRKPGWQVALADMVLHEVTRNETPTSRNIGEWVKRSAVTVIETAICRDYLRGKGSPSQRKANLGELAVQEVMQTFALTGRPRTGVFLFEDHKLARARFLLPDNCHKISTRAFLIFLEEKGLIQSSAAVERAAIQNGRQFSALRFSSP